MKKYDVYGVGNALVDFEYTVDENLISELSIDKGLMTLIDEDRHDDLVKHLSNLPAKKASGGSAANTIIAAAQLGASTFYSCKVANDDTGTFYMNDLHECDVDSNLTMDNRENGNTGKCLVLVTPDADRTMNTFLGITSQFSEKELDLQAIANSQFVYLEGYLVTENGARTAAVAARKAAKAAGAQTALTLSDPNMVQFFKDGLLEMAGDDLDLAFSNLAEAQLMFDSEDLDTCVEGMKKLADRFAITLGADGALLYDGKQAIQVSAPQVTPVDSNGAGDMYAGSFLFGLCTGLDFKTCGELAANTASHLVTKFGPRLDKTTMQDILKSSRSG